MTAGDDETRKLAVSSRPPVRSLRSVAERLEEVELLAEGTARSVAELGQGLGDAEVRLLAVEAQLRRELKANRQLEARILRVLERTAQTNAELVRSLAAGPEAVEEREVGCGR